MPRQRGLLVLSVLTAGLLVVVLGTVWVQAWLSDPAAPLAYGPPAFIAGLVLLAAFLLPALVRPFGVRARGALAWVIGIAAVVPTLLGYLLSVTGRLPFALLLYQGLHIPTWDWMPRFYDLTLVMQAVDCSRQGFDVYAANNGCQKDPFLYGPGQLWWGAIPGHPLSAATVPAMGIVILLGAGVAAFVLARMSSGRGQLALLASVLGASWILLVERANVDAVILVIVVLAMLAVRRWNNLGVWALVAVLIWLMGTWKYYPFALGLMLIPVLRVRWGWGVLVGYAAAVIAFMVTSWDTFALTLKLNATMTQVDDLVVLGRNGVVTRMLAAGAPVTGLHWADLVVVALAVAAGAWGWLFARRAVHVRVPHGMLATAAGSLVIVTLVVGSFGYAYKAAFLLLAVPLISRAAPSQPARWYASTVMVILVAVSSIVVWNTMLATCAAITAGGFALGSGLATLLRAEVDHLRELRVREVGDRATVASS